MYSTKENVNILTSLLVAHGVRHAVVCPGSRNAPITHNLCACPGMRCASATDERSAAFVALGMAQALGEPVAVCVTSGSALLNTLPAVAEAFYQHLPLVVISADRPAAMIGQLQGQTLPQPGALGRFVRKAVSLPEPRVDAERWHCNRLANEALVAMRQRGGGPVHVNVPISEPLFDFSVPALPDARKVSLRRCPPRMDRLPLALADASRPMVVIGQLPYRVVDECREPLAVLRKHVVVLQEQLSDDGGPSCLFDEALRLIGDDAGYQPDVVVYVGDTLVSKRAKRFLQRFTPKRTVIVNETGELTDVTMHATDLVECPAKAMLTFLAAQLLAAEAPVPARRHEATAFYGRWHALLAECRRRCDDFRPAYSQMLAVKLFQARVNGQRCWLHYANSMAVRLGQLYAARYLFVNRGVNGIEGSLSTAVGFAAVADRPVYCVMGDLSFFYDQNALWNPIGKGNLRILLLNNGGGGIFLQLPGLGRSPYRDGYVAASHRTQAKGVCEEAHVAYRAARNPDELADGMAWLTGDARPQPRLLEVFTDPGKDAEVMKRYTETGH